MKRHPVMLMVVVGFLISTVSVFSVVKFARGQDHPDGPGIYIHNSTVDGYQFDYVLYHFPDRKTWHLMVSITAPEGARVDQGKVGFLVSGPDGSKQKTMAMGMKGAYGADMDFGKKGVYTVKTKAVFGDRKLFDRFKYEVR